MNYGSIAGGRRRRILRVGVTALLSMALIAAGTSSTATDTADAGDGVTMPGGVAGTEAPADAAVPHAVPADSVPADGDNEVSAGGHEAAATEPTETVEAGADEPAPQLVEPIEAVEAESSEPSGQSGDGAAETPEAGTGEPTEQPIEPAAIEPMAVPPADGNEAVITVKVGGDRSGSSLAGLAGVELQLYDGGSGGPTAPVGEDWAECISDSAGDCSFTVPETQPERSERGRCIIWFFICLEYDRTDFPAGDNRDRQFWVVQESSPSGWYTNESLVTGGAATQQSTAYAFRTGSQLRAGTTYRSGTHFMTEGNDSNRPGSAGTWQVSRSNPELPLTCEAGIDVALVLDLSGSVANAGAVPDLKASAIAFAEALEGTGSELALFTFATTAPRNTGVSGRNYPDLMPVDGNLSTISSRINSYAAEGGTNWDRGIAQVADNRQNFDLAIVITDGLPTFSATSSGRGDPPGPGSFTRFRETEEAIFSANALKEQGTRVLAVGVGDGISGHADNLRAISGATAYGSGTSASSADYFQTGWQELAPLLENVAMGATCQSSITVNKHAEPYEGEAGPGAGWTFAASHTDGGGTLTTEGSQVTGTDGDVEYTVRFDSPDAEAATVRIEEQATDEQRAAGWSLTDVSCTVNGHPGSVERDGDAVVVAGIAVGADVACTFTNTQTLEPVVTVVKQAWDVASVDELPTASELRPGSTVTDGAVVTWTYTVFNTGQTRLENIVVEDDRVAEIECPADTLPPGEQMECTGSGPVTPTRP